MAWYYWLWIATSFVWFLLFYGVFAVSSMEPDFLTDIPRWLALTTGTLMCIVLFVLSILWPLWVAYYTGKFFFKGRRTND